VYLAVGDVGRPMGVVGSIRSMLVVREVGRVGGIGPLVTNWSVVGRVLVGGAIGGAISRAIGRVVVGRVIVGNDLCFTAGPQVPKMVLVSISILYLMGVMFGLPLLI